uniref:Methyltransferase type 11 domain-containing protein n=1 Tax=Chromera velia CCMP2878 TaxID=1169474 RepID=A0A0G4I728_9ALVE|eukprot:Cvel_1925.t1-p1 / transcript=Cvel_1925.t1 / gene=Cvel_1925 / organism=Chromera_velia_CCMP2878 / gene_product=Demethylmenaquinone methyltransferase, putative / transcript_product=Demethylmenaquinone methyltransferase, putative / location=Cvel_scaffold72:78233-82737(-) / protein_length=315 / sequence_SO=supercontig / SO=protein_coding / is_pseudo=false
MLRRLCCLTAGIPACSGFLRDPRLRFPASVQSRAIRRPASTAVRNVFDEVLGGILGGGPSMSREAATLEKIDPSAFLGQFQAPRCPRGGNMLEGVSWPEEFPLDKEAAFRRQDENDDRFFYLAPRFVHHIDENAQDSIREYYAKTLPSGDLGGFSHLDLCSSWVSHLPESYRPERVAGLGMNQLELAQNKRLTESVVQDLNKKPDLPYGNDEFDVVTNVVSVDYLSRPLEIFEEIFRVLKPGGRAIMSFSNRCFPTKVIAAWFPTNDLQHCGIVASYFKYSGFEDLKAIEVTKSWGDPMYVVEGRKPPSQTSTAQ